MELRKRAIVITGATGGMGQDLCRALAGEGARLAVCGGQKEKVALLQQNLEKEFQAEVYGDSVDVTKEDKIITLSTCTGNDATRFVVQAKREGEY